MENERDNREEGHAGIENGDRRRPQDPNSDQGPGEGNVNAGGIQQDGGMQKQDMNPDQQNPRASDTHGQAPADQRASAEDRQESGLRGSAGDGTRAETSGQQIDAERSRQQDQQESARRAQGASDGGRGETGGQAA
ncbi:hypothetical protein [Sphingopyxis terrae]|uniref:Uncharacterized protein n=1 Tax=Sphingopyxis terrae subsp. ummariensis TaxID=429001 RepID=A0A1Y6FP75_9SPHN|nr:hypothetical protein [Sphingopyxis terrae]SMQ76537.1 hypothetical protein SAMN06295984_1977 [Sphingopyxis terrae subsp. ummariensis]